MDDKHCHCCGVEYEDIHDSLENSVWISSFTDKANGKICYWCADNLPGGLVDVACRLKSDFEMYNIYNFKSHSVLKARIDSLKKPTVSTPNKSSDWNTVCQRCGAPAYQGLFKVECSRGCK